jgi:hypothetical protein
MQVGQQGRQLAPALQCSDAIEQWLQGLEPGGLHGALVHARSKVVAQFGLIRAALGPADGELGQDAPEVALVLMGQLGKDAPAGMV